MQVVSRLASPEPKTTVLVGVGFPIGLPRLYAAKAGIATFEEHLRSVASAPDWSHFFVPNDDPNLYQPFAPASEPSSMNAAKLAGVLGLRSKRDLYRRCDRRPIFDMRFPSDLAQRTILGWQDVLLPHIDDLRLWPFRGSLEELLANAGVVVAEINPAKADRRLKGLLGHADKSERLKPAKRLLELATDVGLAFEPNVLALVSDGAETALDFEAVVSLVSMLLPLRDPEGYVLPDDDAVSTVEGWILGRREPSRVRPRVHIAPSPVTAKSEDYAVRRLIYLADDHGAFDLATPDGGSAINVICGLNNVGKSYLLDQLDRVLKGKSHRNLLRVEPLPRGQPQVLYLGRTWEAKDRVGGVNLEQAATGLSVPRKLGDYSRAALRFFATQFAAHLPNLTGAETAENLADPSVREQIHETFGTGDTLYRCDLTNPVVQRLARVLNAVPYFRCSRLKKRSEGAVWEFELHLLYEDGRAVPYSAWSDGQKAFFYVLVALDYFRPHITLFDEPENHLHPSYVTELLDAFRSYPGQYIIATHHPHLIFSIHADRVLYLETDRPRPHPAPLRVVPYPGGRQSQHYTTRAEALDNDFDRITAAYKLFHYQDDQLLRQAAYIESMATIRLARILAAVFEPTPEQEKGRPTPDIQTRQLAAQIGAFLGPNRRDSVRLLDLGAGLGRQVAELDKLSRWQLGGAVSWTCYEPDHDTLQLLTDRFRTRRDVRVIGDAAALLDAEFDLCLIANVLHELNPMEFADLLLLADRTLERTTGSLVILELFPMLHPEGYAVPYDPATLQDLLRRVGFVSQSAPIYLEQRSVTAYCLLARRMPRGRCISSDAIVSLVESTWEVIRERVLADWAMRSPVRQLSEYQRVMSHLTTIMSIEAWRSGYWRSGVEPTS